MMNKFPPFLFRGLAALFIFFSILPILQAQDFMMQGWYWDYPKTCNGANWADTLNAKAAEIGNAGITYVWLPPLSRASFGSCSNGYDPKDLYDLGEYGQGATGFGTRSDVNSLITALSNNGVNAVADVVYNHRDGGSPENNQAVKDYITTHYDATKNPFPSDRYRCLLPLGGTSGNGAGDYYFKISSKSASSRFYNYPYTVYMETSLVGWQGQNDQFESEPNGGGDCGQPFNTIQLGVNTQATVDAGGCRTDEFKITLSASDFNAAGDFLTIYLTNANGLYADHRPYGIWNASASADVVGQLQYQTYTDFTTLPSGQGGMNFENFNPNSSNASTTKLDGDWDWLWFFYDYDQTQTDTKNKLFDWTKWLWNNVNIRGYRMDAVKHFDPAFVGELMNDLHNNGINPGMVVGEYFDSNPFLLDGWVDDVTNNMSGSARSNIDVRIFDFALRDALKGACDQFGYDARNVFNSGMVDAASSSGFNVVTFVNNHDFREPSQPVQNDAMLAYAYLLTNNQVGLPSIFYPDYFGTTIPNAPVNNFKTQIDQLISIHQQYIFQSNSVDYLSRIGTPYNASYTTGFPNTTLLYQLSGGVAGQEIIVAINFAGETLNVNHQVNMTNVNQGDAFFDLVGNAASDFEIVNGSNELHIELPPRSYAVWVQGNAPLPVELLDFQAQAHANAVQLHWQVAVEEDLIGYAVERSIDGEQFEQIGWENANNLVAQEQEYQTKDLRPLLNQDLYYRLRIEEADGAFRYSPVRVVRLETNDANIHLIPNPFSSKGTIVIDAAGVEQSILSIYHASGQLMLNQILEENTFELNTEYWPNGIYMVQLEQGSQIWNKRWVKTD